MSGKLEKEKLYLPGAILIVAVAIFFLGPSLANPSSKVITTTAEVTEKLAPDVATVSFGVETEAATALESQTANREISDRILEAVRGYAVLPENVKTTQYSVEPIRRYNPVTGEIESEGFRTTQILTVTLEGELHMDSVGQMIDAAIEAGANRVDSVVFSVDEITEGVTKQFMLSDAAFEARLKADAIANGLGVKIVGVRSASESSFTVTPFFANVAESAARDSTTISPGEVELRATVTVSFDIL